MQIGWEALLGFSEVYVVFENVTALWWLRFLKPVSALLSVAGFQRTACGCLAESEIKSD
mgnify:CR=1 FL=1